MSGRTQIARICGAGIVVAVGAGISVGGTSVGVASGSTGVGSGVSVGPGSSTGAVATVGSGATASVGSALSASTAVAGGVGPSDSARLGSLTTASEANRMTRVTTMQSILPVLRMTFPVSIQ
jgi:hypothetical protein